MLWRAGYRGSILHAQLLRLQGMHGEAYRHLTWAIDMLEAVDQEFRVSERRAFDECGSAFRPSIKRAVWQVGPSF